MKIEKKVTKWKAPAKNDVRVLGMPNIPHPLQGPGCQPRTIAGTKNWDIMRKKCYEDAGYKCEVCGYEHQAPADLHAHELFDIDYEKGTSTFVRLICLCPMCHLRFIHSGRALTMYKNGDPLYSKDRLLEGVEHGFKLISEYNKTHKRQIYVFSAIADYLKEPELREPMEKLINHYHISFYKPVAGKKQATWSDWKLIWNGREYRTPYADSREWEKKMTQLNKKQHRFETNKRMSGGVFDELDELLKGENNERN